MKKFKGKLKFKKTVISDMEQSSIEGGTGITLGCLTNFCSSLICLTKKIDVPTWADPGCPSDGCGIG
jgi:hypothetical protein